MSLWRIAWKSIRHRGLASTLTAISMALGVMLVVSVLSIHGVISESFHNNSSLGYNMIVGAKGGKLQLTLNTVYYLSEPVENVPFDYYLEFKDQAYRDAALRNSLEFKAHVAQWQAIEAQSLALQQLTGPFNIGGLLLEEELKSIEQKQRLDMGRPGEFSAFIQFAIPLCLGDYYDRFRIIGTTPAMFDDLVWDPDRDLKFVFAEGQNFEHFSQENGYYEAVVGATVAREKQLRVGQKISPIHGAQDGQIHENEFTIVGILSPSGTPHDRGVFINMEGFLMMDDHAKPLPDEVLTEEEQVAAAQLPTESPTTHHGHAGQPLPTEQREVTSILVRTSNPFMTPGLQQMINEGAVAQGVLPIQEIYMLFEFLVRPIQYALLVLTTMICAVSGVSILVSIYNSMSDRRHEIAVMRALGANRGTVMCIILLESLFLSLGGGVLGWVMGHTLNVLASPRIEAQTGISLGFFDMAPPVNLLELLGSSTTIELFNVSPEFFLIPALMILAVLVGFIPALSGYRTDVSKSLGK